MKRGEIWWAGRPLPFEVCGVRGSEPRLGVDRNPQEPRFAKSQTLQGRGLRQVARSPSVVCRGDPLGHRGWEISAVTLQCQVLLVAAFVRRAASQYDSVKYCKAKNSRNKAGMSMKTNDESSSKKSRRPWRTGLLPCSTVNGHRHLADLVAWDYRCERVLSCSRQAKACYAGSEDRRSSTAAIWQGGCQPSQESSILIRGLLRQVKPSRWFRGVSQQNLLQVAVHFSH